MNRATAVVILAIFTGWLILVMVGESLPWPEPASNWDVVWRLGLLLLGPFCWLALIIGEIRATRRSRLSPEQIAAVQNQFRVLGPLGNVRAIFKLTAGTESARAEDSRSSLRSPALAADARPVRRPTPQSGDLTGGPVFAFKGRGPFAYRVVLYVWIAYFTVTLGIRITSPWWAPRSPGPAHPYGVLVKRTTYYYPFALGWPLQNFLWVALGVLAISAVIIWLHRDEIERV